MLSKKHTQFMFNTNNNDINNGTTLAHELIMKGGGESYVHKKHVFILNCCGKFKGSVIRNHNSMIKDGR